MAQRGCTTQVTGVAGGGTPAVVVEWSKAWREEATMLHIITHRNWMAEELGRNTALRLRPGVHHGFHPRRRRPVGTGPPHLPAAHRGATLAIPGHALVGSTRRAPRQENHPRITGMIWCPGHGICKTGPPQIRLVSRRHENTRGGRIPGQGRSAVPMAGSGNLYRRIPPMYLRWGSTLRIRVPRGRVDVGR